MTHPAHQAQPVAVVGLAALFPGGAGVRSFWTNVTTGRDLIRDVPRTHWLAEDFYDADPRARDKVYARRGGFIDPVEFDFAEFGVPPSVLPATDPAQLLALWVARQALADARGTLTELDRERVSVILGVASTTQLCAQMAGRLQRPVWAKALREEGLPEDQVATICERIAAHFPEWQENTFPGLLGNVVAGRIANRLDLGGSNCVVDAACASSLAAVHLALDELYLGQSDAVVTGGVDALNDILMYSCFSKTGALSRSDDCRPFSADADGTLLGEGIGMLVLRRLADAERYGNPIYAVIRGCGTSSDGRSKSIYAPRADGQLRAYRRAYERAGYGPESVELVEAHGTGTVAGDAAELAGLKAHFGPGRPRRCAVGSIKSQIGHTKAAAGAASLLKVVLALRQGVLPPTLKAGAPTAELAAPDSPFYLNARARPWVREDDHPRRAAVSSFGFGGSNYHVTVEEYRGPGRAAPRLRVAPSEVVILAAETVTALAERCRALAAQMLPGALPFLARQTQQQWEHKHPVRLAIVCADESALASGLDAAARHLSEPGADRPGERILGEGVYLGVGAEPGRIVFLFPGQGSQYPEMGADLAMFREEAASAWDLAARICSTAAERLQDVVFAPPAPGPDGEAQRRSALQRPEWAQPALAAASLAALRVLAAVGVSADLAAGHSFGELTALHAAGVWSAEDLLRAARVRGAAMTAAAKIPGAMTAVSQRVEATRQLLADLTPELVFANHNGPEQLVISGPVPVIERAEERLGRARVRFARLPVASAFHSPLVAGAVATLEAHLAHVPFASPRIPVIAGSTAEPYPADDAARRLLGGQLTEPVDFVGQVETLYRLGGRTFVEVGAGSVLTGLVENCLKGRPVRALSIDRKGAHGVTALCHSLARLAVAGVPVNWDGLWKGFAEPTAPSSVEKGRSTVSLTGALYQKPYPPAPDAIARPVATEHPQTARREAPAPLPHLPEHPVSVPRFTELSSQPFAPREAEIEESEHEHEPTSEGMPAGADAEYLIGQLAEAQQAFQKQLLRGHKAFLRTLEALGGVREEIAPPAPPRRRRSTASSAGRANVHANGRAGSLPPPASANGTHGTNGKAHHHPPPVRPVESTQPETPATPTADDLTTALMETIVAATGYPRDVLGAHMELEADLGVDSIKRVEIFSGLHKRLPDLPELPLDELTRLKTLGEIVEFLRRRLGATAPAREPAPPVPAPAPTLTADRVSEVVLSTVSEKTGYPREVLELRMDLEADLGIDSIKRVEILSAVHSALPGLPELPADQLASLKTLAEVVGWVESRLAPTHSKQEPPPLAARASAGVHRAVLRVNDKEASGFAPRGLLPDALIGITEDGTGVATALCAELEEAGLRAVVVDPGKPAADLGALVLLDGLRAFTSREEAAGCHRSAFDSLQKWGPQLARRGGLLITVQDTGGSFGLDRPAPGFQPWAGGLSALTRTAAAEWPALTARAIDCRRGNRTPAEIASALARELLGGGSEPEVGLSEDGSRRVPRLVEEPISGGTFPLAEGDVVLAVGGARGVTAACLEELAGRCRLRFALVGRTPLEARIDEPDAADETTLVSALLTQAQARGAALTPAEARTEASGILAAREVRATLDRLQKAGSETIYLTADCVDAGATQAAIDEVRRRWGAPQVVLFAAGVLADKLIAEKTPEQFDRVFGTKVAGLANVLAATGTEPLKCLLLFSSIAARTGNPGQCDYAAANEVLNQVALAEARQRNGCLVKSFCWGPWDGGMVTPALRRHFEVRGVPVLSVAAGVRAFAEELGGDPADVVLVVGGAPQVPPKLAPAGGEFHVLVGARSAPFLADHVVRDVPVLAAALVVEWFARAVRSAYPARRLAELEDFRVLRGVPLPDFATRPLLLVVKVLPGGTADRVRLELHDAAGHVRYSAGGILRAADEFAPAPPLALPSGADWPFELDAIYDGPLFHGPRFQTVVGLDSMAPEGGSGRLIGTVELGWEGGPFLTDPAALDGCLQLPMLWGGHYLRRQSLPTRIGRLVLCAAKPAAGESICQFRAVHHRDGLSADVLLADAAGRPILFLGGLEMVALTAPREAPVV